MFLKIIYEFIRNYIKSIILLIKHRERGVSLYIVKQWMEICFWCFIVKIHKMCEWESHFVDSAVFKLT